jgi:hypothetical protein
MGLRIGIVGLPNVGKSTLFNALTKNQQAAVANYPFCTIDPNVGIVAVPDKRIDALVALDKPASIISAVIEFVDIAGLVKGASLGEGLGNQFLSHIREVDAIAHVVRVFEDNEIIHVHGEINPENDKSVIETELILADLQTVDKRLHKAQSESKSGDKEKAKYADIVDRLQKHLSSGKMANTFTTDEEIKLALKDLNLLTIKPIIYVLNVKEDQLNNLDIEKIRAEIKAEPNDPIVPICAKIEEELIGFSGEEAEQLLHESGMAEPGLHKLIREAYRILGLETYFTAGPQEVRAWTIHHGMKAPQAAGVIHTDFEKGFIKAEVISYDDYISYGGEAGAKEKGKMRIEGKEYIVKDGDVIYFRVNN